jgi:hypothetical protein
MPRFLHPTMYALVAVLSVAMIGCGPKRVDEATGTGGRPPMSIDDLERDTDHHEHAETYNAAVVELDAMRQQISDAFAAGDIEAADGPIHEVGHVLEDVVDLARKENFSAEAIAEINSAVESLFDAFGRVDERIHGGEGATYDEVQSQIDTAFETLRRHATATQ